MGIERRKSARVPVYMKIVSEGAEHGFVFSYAKDISAGGMALDAKATPKLKTLGTGNRMKLKFKIPGSKFYVTAVAEIARMEPSGDGSVVIGLRFTDLEDDHKKEIERFVSEIRKGNLVLE